MKLFGWKIEREQEEELESFVSQDDADGSLHVTSATGGAQGSYLDLEGNAKSEAELVERYRNMMNQPEVQYAVDDIINEMINIDDKGETIDCVTDDLELPDEVKETIRDEFNNILSLMSFNYNGYEILKNWYVDGRINFHAIIDEKKPERGILELRYIDPRKLRRVKEFEKKGRREINSGVMNANYATKKVKNDYYIFSEKGFNKKRNLNSTDYGFESIEGLKISKDSIIHCNSGIVNQNNTLILSHLDKAFKPLNQLRVMEDASLIYRISRAPERRVFYIDVGRLPTSKAEQYMKKMMTAHKNKLVYNAETGQIDDDRRVATMTDDFWLPRREGSQGTQIDTLAGGTNLGEMDDILYFQKKLYKSLNVPISRLEPETGFSIGRMSEITRDEVKFSKFIKRLRSKFSVLFYRALEKQLILKNVIKPKDWSKIKQKIRFDYKIDNYFEELKEAEILRERLGLLRDIDEYVGRYYSKTWVRKNILQMNEDDISAIDKEIEDESEDEGDEDDLENITI